MGNKDIAQKIIEKYTDRIFENNTGFGINLDDVIGVSFGYTFKHDLENGFVKAKIKTAITDFVDQLTSMLDDGTLVLSDTWAEDNLGA